MTDCTRKPELQINSNAFKITLPNRNLHSSKKTSNETSLSENEEKIITLLNKKGEIVRKDIEASLKISQAMAVRLLHGLVVKGTIRVIGGGKKTRYTAVQSTGLK